MDWQRILDTLLGILSVKHEGCTGARWNYKANSHLTVYLYVVYMRGPV